MRNMTSMCHRALSAFLVLHVLLFAGDGLRSEDRRISIERSKARTLLAGAPVQEVLVNGRSLWMIVDTGAGASVLFGSPEDTEWSGVKFKEIIAKTPTGPVSVFQFEDAALVVPGRPERRASIVLARNNVLATAVLTKIDGVLGVNYFNQDVLILDLARGHVEFGSQSSETPDHVRVKLRQFGTALKMPINVGLPWSPLVTIDTGAHNALTLDTRTCEELKKAGLVVDLPSSLTTTLAGNSQTKRYVLKECEIAGQRFSNVPLTESPTTATIGNRLLARFQVELDFPNRIAWFRKSDTPADKLHFAPDASGLRVQLGGPDFKKFVVHSVADQSAASDAGFKAGDELIRINSESIQSISLLELQSRLRASGSTIKIELEREGRQLSVDLKLRWPIKYPPDWAALKASHAAPLLP